jgi:hypothetical protein
MTVDKGGALTLPPLPIRTSPDPTKFYFEAVGWDSDGDLVADLSPGTRYTPQGDVSLEAIYTRKNTLYTVRFLGSGSTVLFEQQCTYGEVPTPPDLQGHVLSNGSIFDGWDRVIMTVTENADYVALYTAPPRYLVRFLHKDGRVASEQRLPVGAMPQIPEDQMMLIDDGSIFLGWSPEIQPVSGDVDYLPQYEQRLVDVPDQPDDPNDPSDDPPSHEPKEEGFSHIVLLLLCGAAVLLLAALTVKISARTKEQYLDD